MSICETDNHIVQDLRQSKAFPRQPASVETKETHISWVFLAGDVVYKVKKPVRFDFLDFSTIQRRQHACLEEVRLNRRLAPNVYLDVVPVTKSPEGHLRFGGNGPPIEWAVRMRRLPQEKMLETLLRRGELRPDQVDRLAKHLAGFYGRLAPAAIDEQEYRGRCFEHLQENRRELLALSHHLPTGRIKRIHATQLQCLALRPDLFDKRVSDGRIVEGHGDLRPEHVCFTEPPVVFDCIEFNEDFRTLDVADDLAFLVEECDYLGAVWVGERLIQRFHQLSDDRPDPMLWAFYKSYRACVRAKVAALRADQVTDASREAAIATAKNYLDLAEGYLRSWERPMAIVVGGLSGTGKTTLATELARKLGADLLRTDLVRRQLFSPNEHSSAIVEGIYRPAARRRVYEELLSQAAALHRKGVPVILDGTFASASLLWAARSIVQAGSQFLAIECVCPSDVAMERIRRRLSNHVDASEALPEIHKQQKQRSEPWPETLLPRRVDTQQPLTMQVTQVASMLRNGFGESSETEVAYDRGE